LRSKKSRHSSHVHKTHGLLVDIAENDTTMGSGAQNLSKDNDPDDLSQAFRLVYCPPHRGPGCTYHPSGVQVMWTGPWYLYKLCKHAAAWDLRGTTKNGNKVA